MTPRATRRLHLGFRLAGLAVLLAFALFPIYWMVNTSFKGSSEVYLINPTFYPHDPTLAGYGALFAGRQLPVGFGRLLLNSLHSGESVLGPKLFAAQKAVIRVRWSMTRLLAVKLEAAISSWPIRRDDSTTRSTWLKS